MATNAPSRLRPIVPSPISLRTRVAGALRVLFNPAVKPGRTLGDAAADPAEQQTYGDACPADEILTLDACAVCGHQEHTLVGEFNRFIHFAVPPDEASLRADYSICHGCGVLYAAKRPAGRRYQWLLEHFEESLGRAEAGQRRPGKIAISSQHLEDDDRSRLSRLAARGVFVSEHAGVPRKQYLPALLSDRLASSVHVEVLGSLLDLRGARVLEVRSRLGSIPAALRRLYDADVYAMAIFEGQQFLIGEVYGIPSTRIDFDDFRIPYPGPWDLIVCNHMLTHAVRPQQLLRTLRESLAPGGHVYFYSEPDDAEILADGKSMFNTLNAFHLQTFNGPSFVRALAANGLETVFLTHHEGNIICLAKAAPAAAAPRIEARELEGRIAGYKDARDAAVLMLPEQARARLGSEWPAVVERALRKGIAEFSPDGRIRIHRAERG
jgi:SAM-dependent methyltransferase